MDGEGTDHRPAERWEYFTLRFGASERHLPDKVLNELGDHGWEVITYVPVPPRFTEGVFIFKRRKAETD